MALSLDTIDIIDPGEHFCLGANLACLVIRYGMKSA